MLSHFAGSRLWGVSNQIHKLATFIRDAVVPHKSGLLQDAERGCIPAPDGGPKSLPTCCKGGFGDSGGSLSGVTPSSEATEEFIGDLWLIEGAPADYQTAVPDWISFGSPPNSEKADTVHLCGLVLFDEALLSLFDRQTRSSLVLPEELKVPSCVIACAETHG
jgi:hypothetical protein